MNQPRIVVPDLVDPKTYATHDMTEIWRRLRSGDPVHWHPRDSDRPGFWILTLYDDLLQVLRDDVHFTSEKGNVLATLLQGGDTGAVPVTSDCYTPISRLE